MNNLNFLPENKLTFKDLEEIRNKTKMNFYFKSGKIIASRIQEESL
jgi:hypothetical protein